MHKLFLTIFTFSAALSSFADAAATPVFPGFKSTDAAAFTAYAAAQTGTDALSAQRRAMGTILGAVITRNAATWSAFTAIVDEVFPIDGVDAKTAAGALVSRRWAKSMMPYNLERYLPEGYAFTKANNPGLLWYYVRFAGKEISITDSQLYSDLVEVALKLGKNRSVMAGQVVNKILDLAINMDGAKVKADLTKLNRVYTRYFIADEAAWNKVVANIRANLATY